MQSLLNHSRGPSPSPPQVRNLQGPSLEQCLELRVRSVQEKGFVNYYGEQRFGVEGAAVNAHDIGLAMLKGDHVSVCSMRCEGGVRGVRVV